MSFQLEEVIRKPTWKQVLLDLIISERIDPWNIDIVKISKGFLIRLKEMEKMELIIPANMILASAILLRYKSQFVDLNEKIDEIDDGINDEIYEEKPEISELKLLRRIPPTRQITLSELVGEIDKVIKYEEKRGKIIKKDIETIVNLKIEKKDIEEQMNKIYSIILEHSLNNENTLFSNLISNKEDKNNIVYTLLLILHLSRDRKIDIFQKQLYGEITISIINESKKEQNVDENSN